MFMPWWFNLLLAVIVYAVLKAILPGIPTGSTVLALVLKALNSLAGVISFPFVLISLSSAVRQYRSKELFRQQATILSLDSLSWQQFEQLVGEAYRRQGYLVSENKSDGADGGIDLVLRKEGKKTLVQCKHWNSQQVGVSVVRELYGVMTKDKADSGIVVCSGVFYPRCKGICQRLANTARGWQ